MSQEVGYELEARTLKFSKDIRNFLLSKSFHSIAFVDIKQVVKSSGSIGANYIEANEAMSAKDKLYRMKISRKEAKETIYWLEILEVYFENDDLLALTQLKEEATQLKKILSTIINKLSSSN
jgi:four helix bundle protein